MSCKPILDYLKKARCLFTTGVPNKEHVLRMLAGMRDGLPNLFDEIACLNAELTVSEVTVGISSLTFVADTNMPYIRFSVSSPSTYDSGWLSSAAGSYEFQFMDLLLQADGQYVTVEVSQDGATPCAEHLVNFNIIIEDATDLVQADYSLSPYMTCGAGGTLVMLVTDNLTVDGIAGAVVTITPNNGAPPYASQAIGYSICNGNVDGIFSMYLNVEAAPVGLRLTYTPGNLPANDLAAWNTFFALPSNGNPFTSMSVTGDEVTLFGGSNITLIHSLFRTSDKIAKVEDDADCIVTTKGGKNMGSLSLCPNLTTVKLDGALTIGMETFAYNPALASLSLANATAISSYACVSCPALQTLSLPEVLTVGYSAFNGCTTLTTISMPSLLTLGSGVTDDSVFFDCTALTSITVPIALATINAGSPDGDLVYAAGTLGAVITYV